MRFRLKRAALRTPGEQGRDVLPVVDIVERRFVIRRVPLAGGREDT
jgi:hypothetical protein